MVIGIALSMLRSRCLETWNYEWDVEVITIWFLVNMEIHIWDVEPNIPFFCFNFVCEYIFLILFGYSLYSELKTS